MINMKKCVFVIMLVILLLVNTGCKSDEPLPGISTESLSNTNNTDDTNNTSKTEITNITNITNITGTTNNTGDATTTTKESGTTQMPTNIGNDITPNTQYLYPVMGNTGKWGYVNSKGKLIIDYLYDHADFFTEGAAVVSVNEKYGLIGLSSEVIIEPQYAYIGRFSEGWAHVVKYEGDAVLHGFINKNGEVVYKDFYNNNTGDFHDGLAVFEKDLNFGYSNTRGDIVIQPEYFMAYDFSEGLAVVANESDKHGFIDKTGKLVIPFLFEHNFEGAYLYEGFSEGIAAVCEDGKFGYIDEKGNYVIEPVYDYAGRFNDGAALVVADGFYGYIDKTGKYIIKPQFAYASSFRNGYAFVRKPDIENYEEIGGYALIDRNGDFITGENLTNEDGGGYTFTTEWNVGFTEDLARVVMIIDGTQRFVYIDKNGKIVWKMD
jgi:hypothetical protein